MESLDVESILLGTFLKKNCSMITWQPCYGMILHVLGYI